MNGVALYYRQRITARNVSNSPSSNFPFPVICRYKASTDEFLSSTISRITPFMIALRETVKIPGKDLVWLSEFWKLLGNNNKMSPGLHSQQIKNYGRYKSTQEPFPQHCVGRHYKFVTGKDQQPEPYLPCCATPQACRASSQKQ